MENLPRSVSVSPYWVSRLEAWIKTGIRKSKAEIVEEGLKSIEKSLDREAEEWKDFQRERKNGKS